MRLRTLRDDLIDLLTLHGIPGGRLSGLHWEVDCPDGLDVEWITDAGDRIRNWLPLDRTIVHDLGEPTPLHEEIVALDRLRQIVDAHRALRGVKTASHRMLRERDCE
ncbi:hypothetical protein EDD28_0097 [Salana multivorans]|uniref:Uncharacterized protein n=1 Tax=Salana multivorans TaxID=120377 RepID=A0A3N2D6Z4_9MICO|nr:hypothetical protein [Salana multivorans]ROR95456.1 hypothetical protein EDD28_0009 [Salana multivorans]ROR95540.1 hypothetical protein EDD28_0097 [Salana multivorans]